MSIRGFIRRMMRKIEDMQKKVDRVTVELEKDQEELKEKLGFNKVNNKEEKEEDTDKGKS